MTSETFKTKQAAHQSLIRHGFAFARKAEPPRWWHADGRTAHMQDDPAGRVVVEYRDAQAFETRVWEHEGVHRWTVEGDAGERVAEGQCDSEGAAQDIVDAVVSALRERAASGRVRKRGRK